MIGGFELLDANLEKPYPGSSGTIRDYMNLILLLNNEMQFKDSYNKAYIPMLYYF